MDLIYIAIGALLALAAGSFLTVVVYRLPRQIAGASTLTSLLTPSSRCPDCGNALQWRDKLPVVSWVLLHGRCRDCGSVISWRYPFTELTALASYILLVLLLPTGGLLISALFLSWMLLALSLIDIDYLLLPDAITLPLLWLGLLLHVAAVIPGSLSDAVLGAVAGYSALNAIGWLYQQCRKRPGIGQGDAKLLAALGAWLGWPSLPVVLFLACSSALIFVTLVRICHFYRLSPALPFGPWLSLAAISLFIHSII